MPIDNQTIKQGGRKADGGLTIAPDKRLIIDGEDIIVLTNRAVGIMKRRSTI